MQNDTSASKARLNFFKLILLTAGIAVALYLALNRVKFQNKAAQYPATLVFTPSTATVAVGSTFQAPISLNTGGGAIRGVDVILTFDRTRLQLTAITPNAATLTTLKTFAPVTTTNTFDTAKVISDANTSGTLEFGAVTADMSTSSVTAAYNGSTVLATLTFRGLLAGSASVNFNPATVPVANLTTDTNIVVDSNPPVDTLSSVTNLSVIISAVTATSTPIPPSPTPTGTTCTNNTCLDFDTTPNGTVDISDVQKLANRIGSTVNYSVRYDVRCPKVSPIDISDVQYMANRIGMATCTAP